MVPKRGVNTGRNALAQLESDRWEAMSLEDGGALAFRGAGARAVLRRAIGWHSQVLGQG